MNENDKRVHEEFGHCAGCGMRTVSIREYHPLLACYAFKVALNSEVARANLRSAVEYGMLAQQAGVSLDDAMADFNTVLDSRKGEQR